MLTIMVIMDDGKVEERIVQPVYMDVDTGEVYTPEMIDWDAMEDDRPSWIWGKF